MYVENRIIRNLEPLTEGFMPSRLVHREGQLKTIRDTLKPIMDNKKPRSIFLHGPPGTGKTCMSRFVLEELNKEHNISRPYVNCWEMPSPFKVLHEALRQSGSQLIHRKGTPTDELMESLKRKSAEKPFVLMLDEVDKLNDEKILYDLLQMDNLSLVLISNDEHAFHRSDPRIISRLASSENIEFPKYTASEVLDILKDRKDWGIVPGAVKNIQLETIAEASQGDARFAINILRKVAEEAENQDLEKIPDNVIEKSLSIKPRKKAEVELSQHQAILLDILSSRKRLSSPELYREFQKRLQEEGMGSVTDRTFRRHMEGLVNYNKVSCSGSGRWREYSLIS